jgi:uncharacterized damage-inducible protein DinB
MPTRRPMKKKPQPKKAVMTKKAPPSKARKADAKAPPAAAKKGKSAAPPAAAAPALYDVVEGLMESFATSNRITRFLLENLHEDTWHAAPLTGRGRSIAAIVCHIHNTRVMWLQSFGRKMKAPPKLDHLAVSMPDTLKALDQSHEAISKVVGIALRSDGKIANFKAGAAAFLVYLMTHDAHHRGQICLMAKQAGHPLQPAIGYGMWEWAKR